MPKPLPPYFWENVKKDYEMGLSKTEICKKHKILPSTLSMRIKRNNWVISQAQKDALHDFQRASVNLAGEISQANDIQRGKMLERLNTILEDNELIANNRRLLKGFQSKIASGLRNGLYDRPSDISAGTRAIRDIEAVANPRSNDINIQNTQVEQKITNVAIKVDWE